MNRLRSIPRRGLGARHARRTIASIFLAFFVALWPTLASAMSTVNAPEAQPFTPVSTFFFAEGSTQPPFDTWFLVQNPGTNPANVQFTFQLPNGESVIRNFIVGATSRFSLFANQVLPNQAFSTRIDSDQTIRAERAMYVGFDGDVVTGIPGPNTVWLFAEGSTQNPFHTWLLLQNPNNQPATATITYMVQGGPTATQVVGLPATSRTSIFVNQVLPNQAFSTRIESTLPIIAERSQFRFPGNAATADAGVNAPAQTWFFPNAQTGNRNVAGRSAPFDSFLLLQNPNQSATTATITLFREDGSTVTLTQGLPPMSRQTVFLNQVIGSGSFAVRVDGSQPIIAERSMFFSPEPRGAIATPGSTETATTWFLAEGSTQQPFTEFIFIFNPQPQTMTARVDFALPGGQVIQRNFTVQGNRSLTINVNDIVVNSPVSATVTTSLPSVVERQMYFVKLGSLGGHDTIAVR